MHSSGVLRCERERERFDHLLHAYEGILAYGPDEPLELWLERLFQDIHVTLR